MKRKKHPEHVNHERWLVSYADFITLLFAFFVVMYAISQADMAKFKKVSESIRRAFTGSSTLETQGSTGGSTVNLLDAAHSPSSGRVVDLPAGKANSAAEADPALVGLKDKLEESISLETGGPAVPDPLQVDFDPRGLIVRLAVDDFFPERSAEPPQDLRPLIERIGRVLLKTPRLIRIEGHTDPQEIKGTHPPDEWALSAARAAWVARYWVARLGMDPKRLSIAGYGHYRPITDDRRAWGRGANRRVEILVESGKP